MKAELRETLGKAAYEASKPMLDALIGEDGKTWEEIDEQVRELYRIEAESAVKKLADMLVPSSRRGLGDFRF